MKILERKKKSARQPVYYHGGLEESIGHGDKTPPVPLAQQRDKHIEINRDRWYGPKKPYNQGVIPHGSGPTGLGSTLTPDTLHYFGPRIYFLERVVKALFFGGCLVGLIGATALVIVNVRAQNGANPTSSAASALDSKQIGTLPDILSDASKPAGMYMKNAAWAEQAVEIKKLSQAIRGNSLDPFDSNTGFFNGVDASAGTDDSLVKNQLKKRLAVLEVDIKKIPEYIAIQSATDGQMNTEELVLCGYLHNTTNGAIDFASTKQTAKLEELGLLVYKNN